MNRRQFMQLGAAGWVMLQHPISHANSGSAKKIIWLVLRGAMDSLHAVVPIGDPHLMEHRAALLTPIQEKLLPLDNFFSLHPAFKNLHQWYKDKQMSPVIAVASPYRSRSHFDAQDMLECGLENIEHDNGWLARAFENLQAQQQGEAIAIARSVPVSLRGKPSINTLYPSVLPDAEPDIYDRLQQLYQDDPILSARLQEGLQARQMMSEDNKKSRRTRFIHLAKLCGDIMSKRHDAQCAMLEMGGWDTHNAQANRLNQKFKELDDGLAELKKNLGKQWDNTVVVVATEFGRTVAINGTNGTDHGTASALLLAGGNINGGQVRGQWPGLSPAQLHQNRDLRATSDIRSWLSALLQQHWQLNRQQVEAVFPGVKPATTQLLI